MTVGVFVFADKRPLLPKKINLNVTQGEIFTDEVAGAFRVMEEHNSTHNITVVILRCLILEMLYI